MVKGRTAGNLSPSTTRGVKELKRSVERLQALIDEAPIGICNTDLKGKITYVNKRFEEVSGYSREEVVGKNGFKLGMFPNETVKLLGKRMKNRLMGRPPGLLEMRFKCKDGHWIWVAIEAQLMKEGGIPVGFQIISTDITERKQMEEALSLQQAYFQQLFGNSPEAIVLLDNTDRVVQVNKGFETLFGYRDKEVKGRFINELVIPEDRIEEASALSQAALNNKARRKDTVRKRKDGSLVDVDTFGYPIRFGNKTVGVYAIYSDITERKRMEETLGESREELRKMFESVTDGIAVIDLNGVITEVNQRTVEMHGFGSKDELLGKSALELVAPRDHERVAANMREALKGGQIRGVEYTLLKADGSEFPGELSTSALKDASGNLVGHITIAKNITERKRMEEQLMLTDRLASVGELASGIAHELNNPLTSVIGFSQLLMEENIPDNLKEDLGTIYSEAQRAASIVKNLLMFARKHAPVRQLSQVNTIIEDVLRLRAYEHKVNNIEVDKRFATNLPEIMVDYFQMQQVFLNIIVNAESAMLEANGRGKLVITTGRLNDAIKVTIADDGPGIARENLRRVFDPFFTTKEVGKGTGLGLSICHGIVTGHNGRIYAESEIGKGATFVVELPVNGR
jgi:two-component system NtrC family sensor kinase